MTATNEYYLSILNKVINDQLFYLNYRGIRDFDFDRYKSHTWGYLSGKFLLNFFTFVLIFVINRTNQHCQSS